MTARRTTIAAAALALGLACGAPPAARADQPYAGLGDRPVRALSEQQVADLRAGRGMGLALAAELNGYPGPLHVLEHADALRLSPAQHARTRDLQDSMRAEAVPLGERLIAQEADLDRQFRDRAVTPASLAAATDAIGRTQGALRAAHLRYHLAMLDVLTPEQVRRYGELRGYASPAEGGHGGDHHRPH